MLQLQNGKAFARNVSAYGNSELSFYCIKTGTLYRSKNNLPFFGDRPRKFEDIISCSLDLAKHIVGSQHDKPIDPRFEELTTNPFPFFVDTGDFWSWRNKTYAIFSFESFEKEELNEKCIPLAIPTYEQWYHGKDNSAEWEVQFEKQNKKFSWESKINKAVWRGAATGYLDTYPYWQDLPRAKLVKLSLKNPTLIVAGFKGCNQRNKTEQHEMESMGFMKKRMRMDEFQKFKSVIDIDGNSWSSRFFRLI
jgi:hypothetical protein